MSSDLFDKFIHKLETDPSFRERVLNALRPDEYVRRDEFSELLEEIKQLRIESQQRFEAMDKRFEELIASMNQRFEAVDKRFEAVDRRFEELIASMNQRFKEQEQRFDQKLNDLEERIDLRFEKVFQRFDEMSISLGHDFEEFNSLWLQDFFRAQGFPKLKIRKRTFYDENYEVFPDSHDVEIDIFHEKPLIIGEVTAITRKIEKVTTFLRKVQFLTKRFGEPYAVVYVTYGFLPRIRDEALRLLENAKVKVYTLRQKDIKKN